MLEKIEKLRKARKPFLSKKRLSDEAGISKAMYYRYIEKNDAPYKVVEKLAKALDLEIILYKPI